MSAKNTTATSGTNDVTLVICDAAGRVLAVSANAPQALIACSPVAHKHFAEAFGESSAITRWLTDHLGQARRAGDYFAETDVEIGDGPLHIRLQTLLCDQELYGFALRFA